MKNRIKNKEYNNKVLVITILLVLTLIVVVSSVTLAFFTTFLNGNDSNSIITTAKVGQVEYVTTSPDGTNVLPGWSGEASTQVYLISDSTTPINYSCTIEFLENSYMENIYVQTIDGEDGRLLTETKMPSLVGDKLTISRGTLEPETGIITKGTVHEVKYKIIFKEIGAEQNIDQGRTIRTFTTCDIDTDVYQADRILVTANVEGATPDSREKYAYLGGVVDFILTPDTGYDEETAEVIDEEENNSNNDSSNTVGLLDKKITTFAKMRLVDEPGENDEETGEDEEDDDDEEVTEEVEHCNVFVDDDGKLLLRVIDVQEEMSCNIKLGKKMYRFYFTSDQASDGLGEIYEVEYGTTVEATFAHDENYVLEGERVENYTGCSVDGNKVSAVVTQEGHCDLVLQKRKYDINVTINGGYATPTISSSAPSGSVLTYTIIPNSGYTTEGLYMGRTEDNACEVNNNQLRIHVDGNVNCTIDLDEEVPLPRYTVTLVCNNCTSDSYTKTVREGKSTGFTVYGTNYYTVYGAKASSNNETVCQIDDYGNLHVKNVRSDTTCTVDAVLKSHVLAEKILQDNKLYRESFDYNKADKDDNTGKLYYTTDTIDGSRSYFYRGEANNNWVIFGKSGNDYLYWRIIRTNSDVEGGGVRLLYTGRGTKPNQIAHNLYAYVGHSYYNAPSLEGNATAVGYMYGSSNSTLASTRQNVNSSRVKNTVDDWYSKHVFNYNNYVNKNAVYCGDTGHYKGEYKLTNKGLLRNMISFDGYGRIINDYPTLKCVEMIDRYSVTTKVGNGFLTYPAALMTADEAMFAGGSSGRSNKKVWYYTDTDGANIYGSDRVWTMTAKSAGRTSAYVYVLNGAVASYKGAITNKRISDYYAVRPVISLNSDVLTNDGDGTYLNPYIIMPYKPVNVKVVCEHCTETEKNYEIDKHSSKTVTFTPAEGYMVRKTTVSGSGCSVSGNALSITDAVDSQVCTINVSPLEYTVKVNVVGGSIDLNNVDINPGENYEGTITPAVGYDLTTATTTSEGCTVENGKLYVNNVTKDITCNVNISKYQYTVGVSIENGIVGSEIIVEHGANAVFTISANEFYDITTATTSTSGCSISGTGDTRTVTATNVTSDRTCVVTLSKVKYSVSISVPNGSSNPSSKLVEHADTQTFTITANSGYTTNGATVSGEGCTISGNIVTVSNVTKAITCTVTLKTNASAGPCWKYQRQTTSTTSGSYIYVQTFEGVYYCKDGVGTMTDCNLDQEKTKKSNGSLVSGRYGIGCKDTIPCKQRNGSININMYSQCDHGAFNVTVRKGDLPETISCTCP